MMEFVPEVNATQLLQLSESVQMSLMKSVEVTAGEVSARIGFVVPIDAVIEAAALAVLLVAVLLCCACRVLRRARRTARDRKNGLIVAAANITDADDCEEHELEQHSHGRGATLGDSDLDDELCVSRSPAPSACGRA